jgi:hypothetical protein
MVEMDYSAVQENDNVSKVTPRIGSTKQGLVSKLGNLARSVVVGATCFGYGLLSPQSSDAGVVLWGSSSNVGSPDGVTLTHEAGATDGFDSYDSSWGSLPPGSPTQYFYPFTSVEGRELRYDSRGPDAPYSPFDVQFRARDTSPGGGIMDINDFQLFFTQYDLTEGITDWNYEWHVPGEFTSSGEDFFEMGNLNDLNWLADPFGGYYALSQGSVSLYGVQDDRIFSTVNMQPVPEPGTMGLLGMGALGLGAAAWKRRRSKDITSKVEVGPAPYDKD